jgi:hypothetical protein
MSQALAEAQEDHMKMISLKQDAHWKEIKTLTVSFQAQLKSSLVTTFWQEWMLTYLLQDIPLVATFNEIEVHTFPGCSWC